MFAVAALGLKYGEVSFPDFGRRTKPLLTKSWSMLGESVQRSEVHLRLSSKNGPFNAVAVEKQYYESIYSHVRHMRRNGFSGSLLIPTFIRQYENPWVMMCSIANRLCLPNR